VPKRSFKLWHHETLATPLARTAIPAQPPPPSQQGQTHSSGSQLRLVLYFDVIASTLHVSVLEGRSLAASQQQQGQRRYVKMYVVPDPSKRSKKKTSTVKLAWDPRRTSAQQSTTIFNEAFTFDIERHSSRKTVLTAGRGISSVPELKPSAALYVALWDAGWNHVCMCYVLIPLSMVPWGKNKGLDRWFSLETSERYTMAADSGPRQGLQGLWSPPWAQNQAPPSSSSSSAADGHASASAQDVGHLSRRNSAPMPHKTHRYVASTDLSYLGSLNDRLVAQAELLTLLNRRATERQDVLMEQEHKLSFTNSHSRARGGSDSTQQLTRYAHVCKDSLFSLSLSLSLCVYVCRSFVYVSDVDTSLSLAPP
jgi:hypothetical protein